MSDVKKLKINGTTYDISASSVIDNRTGGNLKCWTGTAAQYDAILVKDANTFYTCTDTGNTYLGEKAIGSVGADKDLSNLTAAGENHFVNRSLSNIDGIGEGILHALKGYEDSGEYLTDPTGLKYVESYAHSTFDKEKFNVVGSPIILDDGIASSFLERTNYISTVNTLPSTVVSTRFELYLGKFTFSEFLEGDWLITNNETVSQAVGGFNMRITQSSSPTPYAAFKIFMGTGSGTWDISNGDNGVINHINDLNIGIEFKLVHYGFRDEENRPRNKYELYSKLEGEDWVLERDWTEPAPPEGETAPSYLLPANLPFYIGSGAGAHTYTYDLKYFKLKTVSTVIFESNKTGISVIRNADFSKKGDIKLTEDNVASGFSKDNYIETNFNFEPKSTWAICGSFTVPFSEISERAVIFRYPINYGLTLLLYSDYKIGFLASSNGTAHDIAEAGFRNETSLVRGGRYFFKLEFTGNRYNLYLKGRAHYDWALACYKENPKNLFTQPNKKIILGRDLGPYYYPLDGSIDLNDFKIYYTGNLKYQACLSIPYAEGKTGAKVVDDVYSSRTDDMYEQLGYTYFYTVDENGFTLPKGEIYGMMNRRTDVAPAIKSYGIKTVGELNNADNVISEFSIDKYGIADIGFYPGNATWEIDFKVTTGSDVATKQFVNSTLMVLCGPNEISIEGSKFRIYLSSNGSACNIADGVTGTYEVLQNTEYWLKLKFTGTQYIFSYSTNGVNYTDDITVDSTVKILGYQRALIGIDQNGSSLADPFLGSIDLNYSKYIINDKLVWQGTNPNNTYATPSNPVVVIDSYVNGTSWYRTYSDGWCEQGGLVIHSSASNVVKLLKAFANTNYSIVLGTFNSANAENDRITAQSASSFTITTCSSSGKFYWQTCGYIS